MLEELPEGAVLHAEGVVQNRRDVILPGDRQTGGQTDRQTGGQTDRQTDRGSDRQTGGQTDRQQSQSVYMEKALSPLPIIIQRARYRV